MVIDKHCWHFQNQFCEQGKNVNAVSWEIKLREFIVGIENFTKGPMNYAKDNCIIFNYKGN